MDKERPRGQDNETRSTRAAKLLCLPRAGHVQKWWQGGGLGVRGHRPLSFLRTKRQSPVSTAYEWDPGKRRKGYLERKWPGIREDGGRVAAHTENINKGREPRRGFENSCI